jgi:hypothetical protein
MVHFASHCCNFLHPVTAFGDFLSVHVCFVHPKRGMNQAFKHNVYKGHTRHWEQQVEQVVKRSLSSEAWCVKLQFTPRGRAVNLCWALCRASYRQWTDSSSLLLKRKIACVPKHLNRRRCHWRWVTTTLHRLNITPHPVFINWFLCVGVKHGPSL